jgi:hypothetical protein
MEKTVAVDAAKEYTAWEFKDAAMHYGDHKELLQELDKKHDDLERYEVLEESGLMVSLYDIIDWFNKEYLKIKKDAESLPKIELEIDKWEIGKKVIVPFDFLWCNEATIAFTESPINLNEIFHRELTIQDDLKNLIFENNVEKDGRFSLVLKTQGCQCNSHKKISGLDQEVLLMYRKIVDKYFNYLKAYTHFTNCSNRLSKTIFGIDRRTIINTGIYGGDPFHNLEQFVVGFGQSGNEPSYFFTYNLGSEILEKPIFMFRESLEKFPECEQLDKDELLNKNYHEVAKTLKLCRSYLPFKMNSSKK